MFSFQNLCKTISPKKLRFKNMKFARCVFLMIALALFSLHIQGVEVDGSTQELVNSICEETEDYEFCNKILHKNWNASTANLHELTEHIIILAMGHASGTYTFISNILRERPGPDEETTAGLNTCLDVYTRETNIFVNIRNEFFQGDYKDMMIDILSTTKILKECRTDFPIPPNKENPLIEKNREMRILITMSTVSGNMVMNGEDSLLSSVVTAIEFSQ